jgi:TetR/AcrR family transcriptional regulator, transcriptional repressor of bet genes
MPRYVDHDDRRRHIAATAAELVGTRGLEALTFRNVAEAAGSSTTVLTHYFTDKRDLLRSTFEAVAERSGARFDEARRGGGGLRECLEALLPLDPGRQTEWRLLTCYWGMAVSDPNLARAEARHVRSAQSRIESLLRQSYPEISGAELEVVARRLVTLVHGLGAHSALDPDHWSPAEQRRILAHELDSLGGLDHREGGLDHREGGELAGTSPGGLAAAAAGYRARPSNRARAGRDAAARRLRKDLLTAIKQGPNPPARRRRRPFSA